MIQEPNTCNSDQRFAVKGGMQVLGVQGCGGEAPTSLSTETFPCTHVTQVTQVTHTVMRMSLPYATGDMQGCTF